MDVSKWYKDGIDCGKMHTILMFMFYETYIYLAKSWGQHGAHLGHVGPRWAPYSPHGTCYQQKNWPRQPHSCLDLSWYPVYRLCLCVCIYVTVTQNARHGQLFFSSTFISDWQQSKVYITHPV